MCHSLFDGWRKLRLRNITVFTCDHRANQEAFLKPGHLTTTEEMPGRGTHTFISIALSMAGITNQSALFSFLSLSPSPLPASLNAPSSLIIAKWWEAGTSSLLWQWLKITSQVSHSLLTVQRPFSSILILFSTPSQRISRKKALELKICPILSSPHILTSPTPPSQLTLFPSHQKQHLEHQEAQGPDRCGLHPGPGSRWREREEWAQPSNTVGMEKPSPPSTNLETGSQRGQCVTQGYAGNKQGWSQHLNSEGLQNPSSDVLWSEMWVLEGIKTWGCLNLFFAVWPWAGSLAFLCFSFFVGQMGITSGSWKEQMSQYSQYI